jgi:hypothetical protein
MPATGGGRNRRGRVTGGIGQSAKQAGAGPLACEADRLEPPQRPRSRRARAKCWPLGSGYGRESAAAENVPVPGPPLVKSSCFTRCRRQAPTGRRANPTLAGWLG